MNPKAQVELGSAPVSGAPNRRPRRLAGERPNETRGQGSRRRQRWLAGRQPQRASRPRSPFQIQCLALTGPIQEWGTRPTRARFSAPSRKTSSVSRGSDVA